MWISLGPAILQLPSCPLSLIPIWPAEFPTSVSYQAEGPNKIIRESWRFRVRDGRHVAPIGGPPAQVPGPFGCRPSSTFVLVSQWWGGGVWARRSASQGGLSRGNSRAHWESKRGCQKGRVGKSIKPSAFALSTDVYRVTHWQATAFAPAPESSSPAQTEPSRGIGPLEKSINEAAAAGRR